MVRCNRIAACLRNEYPAPLYLPKINPRTSCCAGRDNLCAKYGKAKTLLSFRGACV